MGYSPPKELWFHFHPAPHVIAPDNEERLAASGDLWHDPFETKEEAEARLGESAAEGWVVVGPYTYEGSRSVHAKALARQREDGREAIRFVENMLQNDASDLSRQYLSMLSDLVHFARLGLEVDE